LALGELVENYDKKQITRYQLAYFSVKSPVVIPPNVEIKLLSLKG